MNVRIMFHRILHNMVVVRKKKCNNSVCFIVAKAETRPDAVAELQHSSLLIVQLILNSFTFHH